jgi:hypothetical protein
MQKKLEQQLKSQMAKDAGQDSENTWEISSLASYPEESIGSIADVPIRPSEEDVKIFCFLTLILFVV